MSKNWLIAGAMAISCSVPQVFADWVLQGERSSIDFVSIKKSKVAELHSFKSLNGKVDENGLASLVIELASVETLIPIRNERMKSMLFEIGKFPLATISAAIDLAQVESMQVGEARSSDYNVSVSMHGFSKGYSTALQVVKLSSGTVQVSSSKPLLINADDFGMSAGVGKLQDVAGLSSISTAVPVTVQLVFSEQK